MAFLDNDDPLTLAVAVLVAAGIIGVLVKKGPSMMAGISKQLQDLGLSSETLARSLALGFMVGTFPVYIPTVPTILVAFVARVLGLSVPATLVGLNIATPFFMSFMVPFIRAGERLSGQEALAIDALMSTMKESVLEGFRQFGGRLLFAALAWSVAAPVLLIVSYFLFRPMCRAISTGEPEKSS
eukprot:TRINITY_DN57531_c0_g1_i1.p1 TRINITY_DN57531_c0_g1~~TRINITY_DN57531_c0_g1_i1.p1  ORF type:complete len:203 (-),score=25.53 TRINITY_DN57531_c0_g1_i1:44-595(-)